MDRYEAQSIENMKVREVALKKIAETKRIQEEIWKQRDEAEFQQNIKNQCKKAEDAYRRGDFEYAVKNGTIYHNDDRKRLLTSLLKCANIPQKDADFLSIYKYDDDDDDGLVW